MKTSIIIPTYNGVHKIMGVLHSITTQTVQPDEVIVMIDGSTDGTAEIIKTEQLALPGFRIIEQANGGRAQVRNNGAKIAIGELLLFIDDDMVASPDWLKAHKFHHELYPNTLLTGREEDYKETIKNDFHAFQLWQHRRWTTFEFTDENAGTSRQLKDPYITASNFSIRRDVFFSLNGFDERLRDAEDYDLAVRAKEKGLPIYYNYEALAYNNELDNNNCLKTVKRQRQYASANRQLRKFKPDLYKNYTIRGEYKPNIIKKTFFKLVCSKWWINSVDKGYWRWLPQKLRFKLYDIIITANGSLYPEIATL